MNKKELTFLLNTSASRERGKKLVSTISQLDNLLKGDGDNLAQLQNRLLYRVAALLGEYYSNYPDVINCLCSECGTYLRSSSIDCDYGRCPNCGSATFHELAFCEVTTLLHQFPLAIPIMESQLLPRLVH